jgi:hypothetical protein
MKLARRFAKHLFHFAFPYEGNNFKAKLLHPSGFFSLKVGLIIFQLILQVVIFSPFPKVLGYAANISPQEVIRLTNEKRLEAGLPGLREDPVLSQAALAKGVHMIENGYWAHVAPDGTKPWAFFINSGYRYRYAGENLARDFSNASGAVDAWMASSSHRENLLSDKYKDIGVAVIEGDLNGVDTTIIVQFFGTRYQDTFSLGPVAKVRKTPVPSPSPNPALVSLSTPTPKPTPGLTISKAPQGVEAGKQKVLISPFTVTKEISLAVVGLLLIVLLVDAVVTSKRRIKRIGGRTFAHIAFLGMIVAIVLILKAGEVLL